MLLSFLNLTARNFFRYLTFSLLNISGLVIGISAALIIFMYVFQQTRIGRYHRDNNRVFLVMRDVQLTDGQRFTGDTEPGPLSDYVVSLPEVEQSCQTGFSEKMLISQGKTSLYSTGRFVESTYFTLFNIKMLYGDINNPFPDNKSIVLSHTLANKIFGDRDPFGQLVMLGNQQEFKVSGVYQAATELVTDDEFVIPFSYHLQREPSTWDDSNAHLYVKLRKPADKSSVEKQLTAKIHEVWKSTGTQIFLFVLSDWYMHWDSVVLHRSQDRMTGMYVAVSIGIFILLMACINFINLSTARATTRGKEVGVRKMTGASFGSLVKQFIGENLVITTLATAMATLLVGLILPVFNYTIGTNLSLFEEPRILLLVMSIAIIVGILSGAYPAFLLSSIKPARVLKGQLHVSSRGAGLRKSLVVFQLVLAVILIFSALTIRKQVSYLRHKDLGFDKNNVLYIQEQPEAKINFETFRTELLKDHNVVDAAQAGASPMEIDGITLVEWSNGRAREQANFVNNPVDHDYIPTLGFKLVKGRNFSRDIVTDSSAVIISESASKLLGFDDPIGHEVEIGFRAHIIGVVEDFHNADIHSQTSPAIFYMGDDEAFGRWKRTFVRYKPGTQIEVVAYMEKLAEKLTPGFPLEIGFVDQDFDRQFGNDARTEVLVICFTLVALVIACLGLFGLALFSTQRRSKEIGVRKVLGATVFQLVVMLCQFFLRPLFVAVVIAMPAAYWLMNDFLSGYEFHTEITAGTFLFTFAAIGIITLATVAYSAVTASVRNPVDVLRTE